jgi:HAD superfamily hydrolase (TIGR01490 family)
VRYVHQRGERIGMPQRISACVLGLVRGQRQDELIELCRAFVNESIDRHVVPEVLQVLMDLKALGIRSYVATASPQELADAVAERLGLAGAIGTVSEVQGGRYTGRLASPIAHGPEKLRRVRELLTAEHAEPEQSWAFSDSLNDLAMLEAVGWPVAVNADPGLRRIAASRAWLTIDPEGDRLWVRPRPDPRRGTDAPTMPPGPPHRRRTASIGRNSARTGRGT